MGALVGSAVNGESVVAGAIAAAIGAATGTPFPATALQPVAGGDTSQAFTVGDGDRRFFVKTCGPERAAMFDAEVDALEALAGVGAVRVPRPVCTGLASGRAYLVLEYLDLRARGDAALLGAQLARLHRAPQDRFGWGRDAWIGRTPQPKGWARDWIAFWRERRLGFQFERAAQNGYGGPLQRDGAALLDRLDALFGGYVPRPSLLHGDLWGGNHGYLPDGSPVVFDPASYVGDRECDLAMSELFGGFAPAFRAAYDEAWPLDPGYAVRRTLYNLYHVLNHANMFGGSYVAQAQRMTAQLLAEIR
ncbi:MAG: fructosamine kinase family protein [Thiobacillus sp.]